MLYTQQIKILLIVARISSYHLFTLELYRLSKIAANVVELLVLQIKNNEEILQQSRQIYAILQDKIILQKALKSVTTGYVMLIWKCIPGVGIPEI